MPAPIKDLISIKDLDKIDIRCGTILSVDDIEESDTLVKMIVDLGEEKPRTILCGMKNERENTKEIEGKQALFVVNMKPRTMFGYTSEGMIFDLGYEDGILPALAIPERKLPNGTRAG